MKTVIIILIAGFLSSIVFLINSLEPDSETTPKSAADRIFVGFKENAPVKWAKEIAALEKQYGLERICSLEKKPNNTWLGYYKVVSGRKIEALHEELRKERLKDESPMIFADLDFTDQYECLK